MDTPTANQASASPVADNAHDHNGLNSPQIDFNNLINAPNTQISKCRIHMSANEALLGASVYTKVYFDTKDYDGSNEFSNSGTSFYRFYPAQAGYYLVNAAVKFDGSAAGEVMTASIFKNNAQYSAVTITAGGVTSQTVTITDQLYLVAGDYVEIWTSNSSGGRNILGGTTGSFLTIHRLS